MPVLLMDDIAAELDPDSVSRVIQTLCSTGAQLFINSVLTSTPSHIKTSFTMFHVEHSGLVKMIE
jgi:recombinational DNA repair ATPase RecF